MTERTPTAELMATMVKPEKDWEWSAACASVDPEIFFPGKGGSVGPALSVCEECPVQQSCLSATIKTEAEEGWESIHGIRGGLVEKNRKPLVAAYRQSHGITTKVAA